MTTQTLRKNPAGKRRKFLTWDEIPKLISFDIQGYAENKDGSFYPWPISAISWFQMENMRLFYFVDYNPDL